MGERLMDRMRLSIKDKIELVSANAVQRMMVSPIPGVGQTFDVRGGYVLKPLVDGGIVFIDIPAAQRLFRSQGKWSGIDIKLHDFNRASELAPVLKVHLGENYSLRTWYELHKSVYDVMLIEKWVSFAILLVIVLVAVFNILTSLTMIVLQKQRDIGILQAMGMPSAQVSRIFLLHGLFIGIIGSGIGGAVGVLSVWLQETFGLVSLVGSESFVVEAYPVLLQTTDVIWVVTGSLFLCILAAWYPAIRAAKVDPAAAIRYE
jgi:lipoprotein-releasing system permease protein